MVRHVISLSVFVLLCASLCPGQSGGEPPDGDLIALEKATLLSNLRGLEAKASTLTEPLAKASAGAEIADAAWWLDREWAKGLLRGAYELTLPPEEEQKRVRNFPAGAQPVPPSASSRARDEVRNRLLAVAKRDRDFADELIKLGADRLGRYEEHFRNAILASGAVKEGDVESAGRYILEAAAADPTQITAGKVILDLAAKDRAAADRIIIQYLEVLSRFPLSLKDQSVLRAYFTLSGLVFPDPASDRQRRKIPPAGPGAIKAYVNFVISSMRVIEQSEPGSARRLRGFLLGVWLPLKQNAPELTGEFLSLERLSRGPGQSAALPETPAEEAGRVRREKRIEDALNEERPDDYVINSAISKGDFDKARKMIDKLANGPAKLQLGEAANVREALNLTSEGDLPGAELLAEKLTNAGSILQVYPAIVEKCVTKKDEACATNAVYRAVRQLKSANAAPASVPTGIPASAMVTGREFDPVTMSLSKLAVSIAPLSDTAALEILDDTVRAANRSDTDTTQGWTGFDPKIFRILAPTNELRVIQAANGLDDTLRQVVALAAIYQWEAEDLMKKAESVKGHR